MTTTTEQVASGRWGTRFVRRYYVRSGYLEAGERAAFASVGDETLRGARILDLAIGGGRTTSFLAPVAGTYVGIDLSPEMVELARGRFPAVDLRVGDLRDLSAFADGEWDLVDVSFNSIDAVPRADRLATLREIRRILAPDGHFVVSMLNLGDGPAESPGLADFKPSLRPSSWRHPRMTSMHVLRSAMAFWYHRTTVAHTEQGADWAMRPLRAHEFRFVVHFSRFGAAVRMLREAGFTVEGSWSSAGEPLDLASERVDVDYMHFHCRVAGA
jgi:SAM-dependent methyltransferase